MSIHDYRMLVALELLIQPGNVMDWKLGLIKINQDVQNWNR